MARPTFAFLLATFALACVPMSGPVAPGGASPAQMYTLVNMHADSMHARVSSVNYQRGTLIPLCTPVVLEGIRGRTLSFVVLSTGRRHHYELHRTLPVAPETHLARVFGPACDPNAILSTLSPEDRQGVQWGRLVAGMTKRGVILALGYPPEHATPSLEFDVWRYWESRYDTINVYFQNGYVVGTQE